MMTDVTLTKARIAVAILASGGATRDDGFPKGLLEVAQGMSTIDVEIKQLTSAGLENIIIMTNDPESYHHCGAQIVPDLRPGITTNEISRLQTALTNNSALVAVAVTSDFLCEPLCTTVHNGGGETGTEGIQ